MGLKKFSELILMRTKFYLFDIQIVVILSVIFI